MWPIRTREARRDGATVRLCHALPTPCATGNRSVLRAPCYVPGMTLTAPARAAALGALLSACSSTVSAPADVPIPTDTAHTDVPAQDVPSPRVPRRHRATREACPSERPPATCTSGGAPAACSADSDCTMGTNGRCVGNPHDGCRCNYDACREDAMCTTGGPCACRLATRGASGANVCLPGNCQIDADCGPGGYCSPTFGSCGDYSGVVGYRCHTPQDECVDDEDCAGQDAGFLGQRPYCMFVQEVGRWRCANSGCAG